MIFVVAMYLADAIWAAGAGTLGGNGDGGQQFSCPRRGALAAVPVAVQGEEFAAGKALSLSPLRSCMVASAARTTGGQSPCGSASASEPPSVARLLRGYADIHGREPVVLNGSWQAPSGWVTGRRVQPG